MSLMHSSPGVRAQLLHDHRREERLVPCAHEHLRAERGECGSAGREARPSTKTGRQAGRGVRRPRESRGFDTCIAGEGSLARQTRDARCGRAGAREGRALEGTARRDEGVTSQSKAHINPHSNLPIVKQKSVSFRFS